MLAEFLSEQGEWTQVMPGARACLFSLCERALPLPLRLEPLHFEVLFCLAGMVTLTRRDGSVLRLGTRQVLLLTDISDLTDARVETGLKGVLVAVDARGARESLKTICRLLGRFGLEHGARCGGGWPAGAAAPWRVPLPGARRPLLTWIVCPRSERARWCVWKSVELLYLLSAPEEPAAEMAPVLDQEMIRTLAETRRYMEEHLDEPLSISTLSRRACLSATTFKERFRRLYGLPVHTWLQQRRMERAAELLRDSSLSVLGVAQSVGYSSASQFSGRLPAAVWYVADRVSKKCLNRHNTVRLGDTRGIPSAILFQHTAGRVCFRAGGDRNETTSLLGLGRRDLHGHGDDYGLQTQ